MQVLLKSLRHAALALGVLTAPAAAQELLRFDMEQIPLADINLEGGLFIATLYEQEAPFSSVLVLECQDCEQPTEAVVGVQVPEPGADTHFRADPLSYLSQLNQDCHAVAVACQVTQATAGGLKGYAYVARYEDGLALVEQTYFSNGLRFVIIASGPSLEMNQANVATLLRIAGPYVSGQKQ